MVLVPALVRVGLQAEAGTHEKIAPVDLRHFDRSAEPGQVAAALTQYGESNAFEIFRRPGGHEGQGLGALRLEQPPDLASSVFGRKKMLDDTDRARRQVDHEAALQRR